MVLAGAVDVDDAVLQSVVASVEEIEIHPVRLVEGAGGYPLCGKQCGFYGGRLRQLGDRDVEHLAHLGQGLDIDDDFSTLVLADGCPALVDLVCKFLQSHALFFAETSDSSPNHAT